MTDMMVEVLKERGLVEVFAMTMEGANSDGDMPVTRLAFYDPETRMFFTRDVGNPIAENPEDSARNVMAVVEAHPGLTGFPDGADLGHELDLISNGRVGLSARSIDDTDDAKRWPEYRREFGFPWCSIAAEESKRYTHLTGLAIYWGSDSPCAVAHDWLWDTHQNVHVDPNADQGSATLLGRSAPRDMLKTQFRGKHGLVALRVFYSQLLADQTL